MAAAFGLVACAAEESAVDSRGTPTESVVAESGPEASSPARAGASRSLLGTWRVNDAPPARPDLVFRELGDFFLVGLVDNDCDLVDQTTKDPLPVARIRIDPNPATDVAPPSGTFTAVDFVGIDRAQTLDSRDCGTQSTVLRALYVALQSKGPVKYTLDLNSGVQNTMVLTFGEGQVLTAYQDAYQDATAPPPTIGTFGNEPTTTLFATTTLHIRPSRVPGPFDGMWRLRSNGDRSTSTDGPSIQLDGPLERLVLVPFTRGACVLVDPRGGGEAPCYRWSTEPSGKSTIWTWALRQSK